MALTFEMETSINHKNEKKYNKEKFIKIHLWEQGDAIEKAQLRDNAV